jgi:hypothetical protein
MVVAKALRGLGECLAVEFDRPLRAQLSHPARTEHRRTLRRGRRQVLRFIEQFLRARLATPRSHDDARTHLEPTSAVDTRQRAQQDGLQCHGAVEVPALRFHRVQLQLRRQDPNIILGATSLQRQLGQRSR